MPVLTLPRLAADQSTFSTPWNGAAAFAIEFSPTTNPAQTPVWVDITRDVRTVDISRGKQRQLDRYEAGRATIVLDNRDRAYDPTYTGSPFWTGTASNVVPMRMFRIRAQYGDATYYRFVGFATAIQQRYDQSNRDATCVVELEDAFKVFNLTDPSSPFAGYLQTTRPSLWFRMSEKGTGTTMADSSGFGRSGTWVNGPTYGVTGLIGGDANTAVTLARASSQYGVCTSFPYPTSQLGFSVWFKSTSANDQTIVSLGRKDSGITRFAIQLMSTGALRFIVHLPEYGVHAVYTTAETTYLDGNAHHVFGATEISSVEINRWSIGIDGTLREYSTANLTFVAESTYPSTPGSLFIGQLGNNGTFFDGTLDEFTAYVDTSFTLANLRARLLGIYTTATTRNNGQPTGTHITGVLDACEWPAEDRRLDTGNSTLQADDYSSGTALELLQQMAQTEQGALFMSQDGRVTFKQRRSTIGTAPAATFTDDPTSGVRFSQLTLAYDDQLLYNSVTAARRNGGEITVADQSSIDRYLVRTYTQSDLLYDTDAQTQDFAQWIVNRFGEPSLRVEQMTVLPERAPATLYPAALDLELGDLVTINRTPQGVGSAISRNVLVVAISERLTPQTYEMTLSIAEADTSSYWLLGDTTYSVLDTTTRLAF